MEYIEREYLLAEYDKQHQGPPGGARKIIETISAADVVPVVRCKDCKYWYGDTEDGQAHSCSADALLRPPTHFCAYGQRRE